MYNIYWKKDNPREFDEEFFEGMEDEEVVKILLDLHDEGTDIFVYKGKRELNLNGNYYHRALPNLTKEKFKALWKFYV